MQTHTCPYFLEEGKILSTNLGFGVCGVEDSAICFHSHIPKKLIHTLSNPSEGINCPVCSLAFSCTFDRCDAHSEV